MGDDHFYFFKTIPIADTWHFGNVAKQCLPSYGPFIRWLKCATSKTEYSIFSRRLIASNLTLKEDEDDA